MSRRKKNEFWAVVWADGEVAPQSMSYTRADAIEKFLASIDSDHRWRLIARRWGVRVARVRVETEQ